VKLFQNSYWLKSGTYTFLQRVSSLVFGFGAFFFLIRTLSKEAFGVWAIYLSMVTIIEMGKNGLVQNALIKFLAADNKQNDAPIITASFFLNSLLSLIVGAGVILLAPWLSRLLNAPELADMLYWYLLVLFLLVPFSQLSFIQQANFDFRGIFWSNLVRQGLFFFYVLSVFLFSAEFHLQSLIIVQAISLLLGTVVSWLFSRPYLYLNTSLDWGWVSKLFHYGKYVFGTNISSMLMKSTDQLMLGVLAGPVPVASFNMASRVINFVEVPTITVASIVFPQSALRSKEQGPKAVKQLYEKSVAAILAFLLPVVLLILIFPEFIILIIAGKDYLDNAFLLQIVIFYSLFIPFARQFGTIMDSIGRPHLNFYLIGLLAVINIGVNYLLIARYGVIGAAFATLLTYILGFIANQIILYKLLNVNTLHVFKYIPEFYKQGFSYGLNLLRERAWTSK
jgi:lipopolysaccharide exporter